MNVDAGDELLGYAADVRLSAVSCLRTHLEVDSFFDTPPALPPSTVPSSFFPSVEVRGEKKPKSVSWLGRRQSTLLRHSDLCSCSHVQA